MCLTYRSLLWPKTNTYIVQQQRVLGDGPHRLKAFAKMAETKMMALNFIVCRVETLSIVNNMTMFEHIEN